MAIERANAGDLVAEEEETEVDAEEAEADPAATMKTMGTPEEDEHHPPEDEAEEEEVEEKRSTSGDEDGDKDILNVCFRSYASDHHII